MFKPNGSRVLIPKGCLKPNGSRFWGLKPCLSQTGQGFGAAGPVPQHMLKPNGFDLPQRCRAWKGQMVTRILIRLRGCEKEFEMELDPFEREFEKELDPFEKD